MAFTQENTTGYTDEQLEQFNETLAERLVGLDPDSDEYQQAEKNFSDEVASTQENTTFESLTAIYGHYTKDGADYAITQNPYVDHVAGSSNAYVVNGENYYFAHGFDRAGNSVRLIWEITNPETEDESEACDWQDFKAEPRPSEDYAPWHPDYL